MFDTMTMVKAIGGLCGTLLVMLLGGWAAELIYEGDGGHGDHHEQAYVIEIEDPNAEPEPVVEGPPFEEYYAAADAAAGETRFARECAACHKVEDGENATGPHLFAIVGRPVEAAEGFDYSGAFEGVTETWTAEALNDFITAPQDYAPGTKMTYSGLDDPEQRANLIAYLASIGG